MATIKIISIVQEFPPNQFMGRDNTPVNIYSKGCKAEIDGELKEFVEIKAFDKGVADSIVPDSTHEGTPKEYKGQISYQVSKPRASGGGFRSGGGGSRGGNASFALSYAKDIAVAQITASGDASAGMDDAILSRADAYLAWLNKNAK